ncbi:MAG: ABC transporter ATP-binding protein/permease [Geminocystis sp.]|nr:ABC transporter ATP-binding protein/permease [Geminocystis sp.]HIK38290.1 ABC transporter ATP-binding protein [Geminocystis sp. M7585_C2015_104]MCS7148071.1 ABC transporter ATP-binding protein/permease [Geminocystis sp.]MCX8077815.1 ABC transporter ATP-binding protein/permease [Geminocystis sp.]MDW8116423.1 ABC transporter ATP-binding protein [Geminocystis sp.]
MGKRSRFRKLISYLGPYRTSLYWGISALFVVNILGVYIPWLIKKIFDDLQEKFNFELLVAYVIFLFVLAGIMWAIRMASRILIFGVGRQVEFDLKQRIFEHLLTLEPAYFYVNTSGDLINRATSDVDNIRRLVGFAILSLANTIFAYGLTLPAMLLIDVKLSLMALAIYPLMLITVQLFSDKLRTAQLEVQERLSEMSELIQEDMSGIELIKIYAQEENEKRAFAEKNKKLLKANLKLALTRNLLFPIIAGIANISLLILLWFGTGEIEKGAISVGDFIALIIYVERLVFPTALLGFTITTYQRGEVSIDRVEAIMEVKPKIKNAPNPIPLPLEKVRGEIKAVNLTYIYPNSSRPALKNINFEIQPGELVAIVGLIGAGKSTLASAIPRLLDISPGQLFLDGVDVTKIDIADLRQAIAYVPQESFLFSTTVRNNIAYANPPGEMMEVIYAAKEAQIHQEIMTFPQQYETLVGERGISLSGGQRQRTCLARALYANAPILILDDALSSVDNKTASQILENLKRQKGKTILFITHQLSAATMADRILVMRDGEIVQTGTHESLLSQDGLYKSLWLQHQLEKILA